MPGAEFYGKAVRILREAGLDFAKPGFATSKLPVWKKQKDSKKVAKNLLFLHKVAGFVQCLFTKAFDKVLRYNELGKIVENRVFATQRERSGEYAILARWIVHFLYRFSAPSDTLSPRAGRKGSGGAGRGGEIRWAARGRLSHRTPPLQHLLRIISPSAWCSAKNSLSLPKK